MPVSASKLGAILGLALTTGFFVWERTREAPCKGAVFVELRPPLTAPGNYRVSIVVDDEPACQLALVLPSRAGIERHGCEMALAIETRVVGGVQSLVGLRIGRAPERLRFQTKLGKEILYEADLRPEYAPYETLREESRQFCGERALVRPACVRGSSQCTPFTPSCDGPEDCEPKRVCCVNGDWGLEFGAAAASQCRGPSACLDQFGAVACHQDADCPDGMRCAKEYLSDFSKPVSVCKPGAP